MFFESQCDEHGEWMNYQMSTFVNHHAKLEGNRMQECCARMVLCSCMTGELQLVRESGLFHGQTFVNTVLSSEFAYVFPPVFPPFCHFACFLTSAFTFASFATAVSFLTPALHPLIATPPDLVSFSTLLASVVVLPLTCFWFSYVCCFSSFFFYCPFLFASSFYFFVVTYGFDFGCALPFG